jgi:plastocyanin
MLFAAAPSKVPFYIAGGLLAAWAVLLAIYSIRHPSFPSSKGGRRGVIGVSFLLVLGATSMAVVTAGEEPGSEAAAAASGAEFDLAADPTNIAYDKNEGLVTAGTVTIKFTNPSPLDHNVAVAQGTRQLGVSDTIKDSEAELKVDLKPGKYEFYCTVDSHRAAGMEGVLTVQ